MISVTAETSFEVEVTLTGTFLPGCPEQGPTYASGGQPAEPDSMEDVEVTTLLGLRAKRGPGLPWETVNLLAGTDDFSPEHAMGASLAVQKILANIRAFLGDSADEALMAELPDGGE